MQRRSFVVERECGCHGWTPWRWQVVARGSGRDDRDIVVAYAMTRRGAEKKRQMGQELLDRVYAEHAQAGTRIVV